MREIHTIKQPEQGKDAASWATTLKECPILLPDKKHPFRFYGNVAGVNLYRLPVGAFIKTKMMHYTISIHKVGLDHAAIILNGIPFKRGNENHEFFIKPISELFGIKFENSRFDRLLEVLKFPFSSNKHTRMIQSSPGVLGYGFITGLPYFNYDHKGHLLERQDSYLYPFDNIQLYIPVKKRKE